MATVVDASILLGPPCLTGRPSLEYCQSGQIQSPIAGKPQMQHLNWSQADSVRRRFCRLTHFLLVQRQLRLAHLWLVEILQSLLFCRAGD